MEEGISTALKKSIFVLSLLSSPCSPASLFPQNFWEFQMEWQLMAVFCFLCTIAASWMVGRCLQAIVQALLVWSLMAKGKNEGRSRKFQLCQVYPGRSDCLDILLPRLKWVKIRQFYSTSLFWSFVYFKSSGTKQCTEAKNFFCFFFLSFEKTVPNLAWPCWSKPLWQWESFVHKPIYALSY